MHLFSYLVEHNRYLNIFGIVAIIAIAWIFSKKRSAVNVKLIVNALVIQAILAYSVLKLSAGQWLLSKVAHAVTQLYQFADKGSEFVFGGLSNPASAWGFIFAVKVLPIIIFFGALMALLFHFGIIQRVVLVISYIVRPLLGTSGAETLCAISNSFLGQTEAPLLIRHYLKHMSKSEMLVVMVSGMATISGAILAVFAAMGVPAQHLLASSVMAIPGSIMIAKILYPETERDQTATTSEITFDKQEGNVFSAVAQGTSDGLFLALNVGAMLISFLSLLALINAVLSSTIGVSLDWIFARVFAPFAYLLGFTGKEALAVGELLGIKVTVNELVAYSKMLPMNLSERTQAIVTYALCGFSNFSCIGIQIGGIGALVPEKRSWLCELGLYAVLGGSLSNLLSAMIAGLLL